MTLADALAITLRDLGITRLFGVSGANIELLHDAVHRHGEGRLHNVLTKSESGAAFMADGYARNRGTMGVCCSTSGGGMMNLAVGVAEAQSQCVPLLAIVGQPSTESEGIGGFQDSSGRGGSIDAATMWQAITRYTVKLESADSFWRELQNCLMAALSGRQGAAALLIPRDIMQQPVSSRPAWFLNSLTPVPRELSGNDKGHITHIAEMLSQACRPIVILGETAMRSPAAEAIIALLKQNSIRVATTLGNIAAFDHTDPLYIGSIGQTGHPSTHECIEQHSDLILAIGTQLDEMTCGPLKPALSRLPLIVINQTTEALPPSLQADIVIESDFAPVIDALAQALKQTGLSFNPCPNPGIRFHPALVAEGSNDSDTGLRQSQALAAINRRLPDHSHLIFDAGNCASAAAHYLQAPAGSSAGIALGMAGMGYGIASAIGAALARREQGIETPVSVFCGDGAFMMNGLEIHTAVELRLPIIWIVFNNNQHGMCVTRQQAFFDNRIACSRFDSPINISTLCRGLGSDTQLQVTRVDTATDIETFLDSYMHQPQPGPAVLELMISVEEIPPFAPLMAAHNTESEQTQKPMRNTDEA